MFSSKKLTTEDKARNTSLINEETELRKKKKEDLKNIDKANPFARKKIESTFEAKKNEIHAQRALLKGDLKGAEKHKKLQEFHETKSKLLEAQEKLEKGTGTQEEVDALKKQHDQLKGEADKLTTLGSLKRGSAVTGSALSSVGSAAGTQAKGMLSSLTGAVLQSGQQPGQQQLDKNSNNSLWISNNSLWINNNDKREKKVLEVTSSHNNMQLIY
jgi:hypothetical protein